MLTEHDFKIKLLRCLINANGKPLTAAVLAERILCQGFASRESNRRTIRRLVRALRDEGAHIVADLTTGYQLIDGDGPWREYLAGRADTAKKVLAQTHSARKRVNLKNQPPLFHLVERVNG